MQIGVVFPQSELGGDVGALRAYGEAVEGLGFEHLLACDHVVGKYPPGRRRSARDSGRHGPDEPPHRARHGLRRRVPRDRGTPGAAPARRGTVRENWWKFIVASPMLVGAVILAAELGVQAWFLGIAMVLVAIALFITGVVLGVAHLFDRRTGLPAA